MRRAITEDGVGNSQSLEHKNDILMDLKRSFRKVLTYEGGEIEKK